LELQRISANCQDPRVAAPICRPMRHSNSLVAQGGPTASTRSNANMDHIEQPTCNTRVGSTITSNNGGGHRDGDDANLHREQPKGPSPNRNVRSRRSLCHDIANMLVGEALLQGEPNSARIKRAQALLATATV
jgi:hypothetical protein